MREIKFRAWNHVGKKWDLSTQNFIRIIDGVYYFGNANMKGYPLEIMQYTGLKDKNGKEIYEGDIVQNLRWDFRGLEVVKFGIYSAEGDDYYASEAYGFFSEPLRNADDTETLFGSDIEVIGSIYENPELLTK